MNGLKNNLASLTLIATGLMGMGSIANAAVVAQFDDPAYVNSHGGFSDESATMEASLTSLGHSVNLFTGTGAAAWSGALSTAEVVVLPEQESGGGLGTALNGSGAGDVLRSYVAGGGGLIVSYDYRGFLNDIFGFSLSWGGSGTASLNATDAAGTAFAGGPASLPSFSATGALTAGTLPAGTLSIYESGGNATVALMSYGLGEILWLGWDWFNAAPLGSNDSGWLDVLNRGVAQVAGEGGAVPLPASVLLLGFGLIALGLGRKRARS